MYSWKTDKYKQKKVNSREKVKTEDQSRKANIQLTEVSERDIRENGQEKSHKTVGCGFSYLKELKTMIKMELS